MAGACLLSYLVSKVATLCILENDVVTPLSVKASARTHQVF